MTDGLIKQRRERIENWDPYQKRGKFKDMTKFSRSTFTRVVIVIINNTTTTKASFRLIFTSPLSSPTSSHVSCQTMPHSQGNNAECDDDICMEHQLFNLCNYFMVELHMKTLLTRTCEASAEPPFIFHSIA